MMTRVFLKRGEEARILKGHPWIFDNEIEKVEGNPDVGEAVSVFSHTRRFIGSGFFNPNSRIRIRVYSREDEKPDRDFFQRRISDALSYRRSVLKRESYRLIFGEADLLPGLIVDKFGDYLVLQTLAAGVDRCKELIADALMDALKPRGIYERNDVQVRELEGLPLLTGNLRGSCPTETEIEENGVRFIVDIASGQKTGHFLDQTENHAAIAPIVADKRVLDAFCHTGGFGLHAAHYGAAEVVSVDISLKAIQYLTRNAELNGLSASVKPQVANVFDLLRGLEAKGERFDTIILDPPAFCKSRSMVKSASRGYKEINLRAMKLLTPGGFLVTCSCSYHILPRLFMDIIADAAADGRRSVRIVEIRGQAKDHPILSGYEESQYLKCLILQVM